MLEKNAQKIAEHYAKNVIDYEKIRLEQDSPVEYAITLHAIDRWILPGSMVLDVGTGVGHYADYLASRHGCSVHLVDVCEELLNLSKQRLLNKKLTENFVNCTLASATNLSFIPDQSIDCVLILGPLYHLANLEERQQAIKEGWRVLKKDGIIFAAGINRLAILKELFNQNRFQQAKNVNEIFEGLVNYADTGISNDLIFPPLGEEAYCATVDEFKELFSFHFQQLDLLGVESFTAFNQKQILNKPAAEQQIWLSLAEKMARTLEGIASSEHFLYVGKKV